MRMSTESNKSNDIAGRKGKGEELTPRQPAAGSRRWPKAASRELCAPLPVHSAMSFGYSNIPVAISIHILTELN